MAGTLATNSYAQDKAMYIILHATANLTWDKHMTLIC